MMNAEINDSLNAARLGFDGITALTFNLNGQTFAIDAKVVQEITDLLPETPVPGAKPLVASVINFRGKVIPLADIRILFGMPEHRRTIDSRIIVIELPIEGEPTLIGLRTDKVHEVTMLSRQQSEAPPRVGMRWRPELVECLVKRDDDIIVIPNLGVIFEIDGEQFLRARQTHS